MYESTHETLRESLKFGKEKAAIDPKLQPLCYALEDFLGNKDVAAFMRNLAAKNYDEIIEKKQYSVFREAYEMLCNACEDAGWE